MSKLYGCVKIANACKSSYESVSVVHGNQGGFSFSTLSFTRSCSALHSLQKVRRDGDFKYIKTRSEHNHTRCRWCKSLQVCVYLCGVCVVLGAVHECVE